VATPNYNVNYEDERFQRVEADKQTALQDVENTYSGMIEQSDQYYQAQIDNSKAWADKQSQLQQERTDFTIEKIEQQKDQAQQDYLKEQSGSYADWQKQSNTYGSEAEQMASAGLQNTGFSESSQVAMYNAYQNRVAAARDTYNRAVINYNNAMTEARLQNNSVLADIAFQSFEKQLELSLQGFQYKNTLVLEQANKKLEVDNTYYQRYQDVLGQINTENAMKEEVRQFNQQYNESVRQFNLEYQQKQKEFDEGIRQFNLEYQQKQKEFNEGIRQFNEEIARLKKKDAQENKLEIQRLELSKKELQQQQKQFQEQQKLKKQELQQQQKQFQEQQKLKKQELTEQKRQFNAQMAARASSSTPVVSDKDKKQITDDVSDKDNNQITDNRLDLGRGALSDAELARLISQGKVAYKKVGNKVIYRWSGQTKKQQELINGQTALEKYAPFHF
jgi:hypothetical protein